MQIRFSGFAILVLVPSSVLLGDFSYEQNSRITGGALAGAMKVAAVFSKQARQPMRSTVAVKGDRMVHADSSHGSIIDLNKETITNIDFQKKTWSVMTFAEMQQAMQRAATQMKERQNAAPNAAAPTAEKPSTEMKYKVSINSTGRTKDIDGLATKETIMRMEMEANDEKNGQKGTMVVTMDTWRAARVPGYEEILEFYKRMAQKLAWVPGEMGMMSRPDLTKAMVEVSKESGKLEGMSVYETIRMGGEGTEGQAAAPGEQPKQQQSQQPTVGSALGGALGGRFGLGKKKQQQDQPPPASSQPPPAQGDAGLLLEMVTETGNFSSAPVDPSKFDVPKGFKQVQSEIRGGAR